jgi:general secretion pathway protein K
MGSNHSAGEDPFIIMKRPVLLLQRVRGAALMLSLWALFLLSAMVISWALEIDSQLTLSGNANRLLDAEAMACSGAEVALHPAVKPGSPNLTGGIGRGKTYEARISGEGGRLNINWLLAGEDPDHLKVLERYLENKGIDLNEREHMMDCLLDWVDPDNLVRLNGAEESEDYHPANTLLTRIDELKKVKGWAEFTSHPGWDEDLTLNSTGPVDVAWASRDVLLALPGMNEQLVDRFLEMRRGPDGIDGTADDTQFKTLDEVRSALGFTSEQFEQLAKLVSFKDPVYRVVSVGKAGNATRTVQFVFRRVGVVPQVITWKEF